MEDRTSPLIGAKIISVKLEDVESDLFHPDILSIELETTDGKRILLNPEAYVGWENDNYIEWEYKNAEMGTREPDP